MGAVSAAAKVAFTTPEGKKISKAVGAVLCVILIVLTSMCGVQYQQEIVKEVAGYFREPLTNEYYPKLAEGSATLDTKLLYATYIQLFYSSKETKTEQGRKDTVDKLLSCFFELTEIRKTDSKGKEIIENKYSVVTDVNAVFRKIETTFQINVTDEDKQKIMELKENMSFTGGYGNASELSEFALQFVGENHTRFTSYSSPNGSGFGDNWCAMFVSYCTDQMGYIDQGIIHYFVGCTSNGIVKFRNEGRFEESAAHGGTYVPSAGDIIFFNWDGYNSSADHVGIVTEIEGTVVSTVEGNSGYDWTTSTVKEKKYELSSSYIVGYFPLSQYVTSKTTSPTK